MQMSHLRGAVNATASIDLLFMHIVKLHRKEIKYMKGFSYTLSVKPLKTCPSMSKALIVVAVGIFVECFKWKKKSGWVCVLRQLKPISRIWRDGIPSPFFQKRALKKHIAI